MKLFSKILSKNKKILRTIKSERLPLVLGGMKYRYKLSKKGINFLKRFLLLLQAILPSLQENTLKQRIIELLDSLPDILNELKVALNDTQNKKLRNKIKIFFKI